MIICVFWYGILIDGFILVCIFVLGMEDEDLVL